MGSNRRPERQEPEQVKITADAVIAKYIETRDIIEVKKKAFDAEVADLKELQTNRETWLQGEMNKLGLTSFKSAHGIAFTKEASSVSVADAQTFMEWVHADWESRRGFLTNAANKTAVVQRMDDGESPPPGVNFTTVKVVQIRRA